MDSDAENPVLPGDDVDLELEYEIEEDVKAELEDFVRLSHMGQFKDAHQIFDECLSGYDDWYPVVAEYADCLLREGDFEQLAAFSEEASLKFQDPSEIALLELMYGIGCLLPRHMMWQRLQELWPDLLLVPPYTSLRDTHIHLLEIALQILVFSRLQPEDLDITLDSDLASDRPWSAFIDWFYFLLCHEYFWEAQRILHSLFYKLPQLECQVLVHDYISQALSTNIDQEPVQIAVSSMVQQFVYAFGSTHPSPLAVVQWNDAITWALFDVTLAKPNKEPTSPFNRICLRRSLQEELELNDSLPLSGANDQDETEDLLHEAAVSGDTEVMQAIIAGPVPYTLDELNSWAFSSDMVEYSHRLLPFLKSESTNLRDGYQRTPLHWASLTGQGNAVETLLCIGEIDTDLLDWFGCTPLHYAVRSCLPGSDTEHFGIVRSLLMSDSAGVNTRDSCGLTPLYMAIVNQSYDLAKLLLEHNAIVETSDYGALLLLLGGTDTKLLLEWKCLLSQYDDPEPWPFVILASGLEPVEPITPQKASLGYPGTIDLNTSAALVLRHLPYQSLVKFLPRMLPFLECDFSDSTFPSFKQEQDLLTNTAYFTNLAAAVESQEGGYVMPDSPFYVTF